MASGTPAPGSRGGDFQRGGENVLKRGTMIMHIGYDSLVLYPLDSFISFPYQPCGLGGMITRTLRLKWEEDHDM